MSRTLLIALLLTLSARALPAEPGNLWPPRNYDPGVLVEWNALLVAAVPDDVGVMLPQYYALMYTAMYDAVVSIEGGHPTMRVRVRASRQASSDAAAAQAAHDVLVAVLPSSAAAFDKALASRLGTINPNRAQLGAKVGREVARKILEWRAKAMPLIAARQR
jgi:hypothetical protein